MDGLLRLRRGLMSGTHSGTVLSAATWSPTDHSAFVTIAPANIGTRNSTLGGAYATIRSDLAQSSGVRYVEFTILQIGSGGAFTVCVGLANGAAGLGIYAGSDNNGISWQPGGNVLKNAGFVGGITTPSFTTGDVLGMVVDLDAHTVKFNKNGAAFSATADITSLGSDVFVACTLGDGSTFSSVQLNP